MSVQLIGWFKGLFKTPLCGICSATLDESHGIIYYKATDCVEPQEMKVCSSCMSALEESHQQARKIIDNDKKVLA